MAKYGVDFAVLSDAAGAIRNSANNLSKAGNRMASIRSQMGFLLSPEPLKQNSSKAFFIEKHIFEEASRMNTLAEALEKISGIYVSVEGKVTPDVVSNAIMTGSPLATTGLAVLWKWFRDLLGIHNVKRTKITWYTPANPQKPAEPIEPVAPVSPDKPSTPEQPVEKPAERPVETPVQEPSANLPPQRIEGQPVSASLEAAQDYYMQNEISRILSQSKYSESTWKASNTQQREAILVEYVFEVAGIMGISLNGVNFFYAESENGYYTLGQYSNRNHRVLLNEWVIENRRDSYNLMKTSVHELRHAYQYAAIEDPDSFLVSEETIQKWQDSFINYKTQSSFIRTGMSEKDAFQAYRNQAVEVDARKFAKQS